MSKLLWRSFFLLLALFLVVPLAQADTGSPLSGYAWSSNIGWISFRGSSPDYGVNLAGDTLSGYAWSPNIGWISFNNVVLGQATPRAKALTASGTSGWDGNISLQGNNGLNYGVSNAGDHLTGYAWGSTVVGWVDFSRVKVGGLICSVVPDPVSAAGGSTDVAWTGTVMGGGGTYDYTWSLDGSSLPPEQHLSVTGSQDIYQTNALNATAIARLHIEDAASHKTADCSGVFAVGTSGTIPPEINVVSGRERLEISSQPLASPAISSVAKFHVTHHDADQVTLKITEMKSLGSVSDLLTNPQVTCRWSKTSPPAPSDSFTSCSQTLVLDQFDEDAYLNIKVERPTATIRDGSPYQVTVGLEGYPSSDSAVFDYRVGTVNPR